MSQCNVANWEVACATGHRPRSLDADTHPWIRDELHRLAVKLRDTHGTQVVISGMAVGVDQWWAQAALDAGLVLWAYVPFPQQSDRWPDVARTQWRALLDRAARVRQFGDHYDVRWLHARNDGMLTDSRAVVAVHLPDKATGGTASAVRKAERLRMPIIRVNPATRAVTLSDRQAERRAA